jgi:hypothetical protein
MLVVGRHGNKKGRSLGSIYEFGTNEFILKKEYGSISSHKREKISVAELEISVLP